LNIDQYAVLARAYVTNADADDYIGFLRSMRPGEKAVEPLEPKRRVDSRPVACCLRLQAKRWVKNRARRGWAHTLALQWSMLVGRVDECMWQHRLAWWSAGNGRYSWRFGP